MKKWHPPVPTQHLSLHGTCTGVEQGKSRDRKQEITMSSCSLSFLAKKRNPKDARSRQQPALVIYCAWSQSQLPMETTFGEHGKQKKTYRKFANEFVLFYPWTLFTGRQLFSIVSFMSGKTTKPIVYNRHCFFLTRLSKAV